jgi:hypothetical protein
VDRHHPMGVHSPGTLRDSCKGALETGHLSLYGSSVRRTWRRGSFARDPEGYERKALGMGIPLYGVQFGNQEWAHLLGALRYG